MRSLSPIALLLVVACGEGERPVLIRDFASRSETSRCEQLRGPEPVPASVTQLQPATDSTFLLVDAVAREVALLDRDAGRWRTIALTADGPRGVAELTDAGLSGDSLLVIADGGRHRVLGFDRSGSPLWTVELSFPPQRLSFAGDELLIAAAGLDSRLPGLLYALRGEQAVPLRVPFAAHVDGLARLFLNYVTLQGYADGSAVVAHQFVRPRAWRVEAGGEVTSIGMPVPAAVEATIGFLPPIPFREEDLERIAAPVIASAPDPHTGGLLYITRSGRRRDGRSEKALVRVDREMRFVRSRLLAVNAVALAWLPADPGTAIVVDNEQQWHRCEAP